MAQLVVPQRKNPLDDVAQLLSIKGAANQIQSQQKAAAAAEMNRQQQMELQGIFKDPANWDQAKDQLTDAALLKVGQIHPQTQAELLTAWQRDPKSLSTIANQKSEIDYRTQQADNLKADNTRLDAAASATADAASKKTVQIGQEWIKNGQRMGYFQVGSNEPEVRALGPVDAKERTSSLLTPEEEAQQLRLHPPSTTKPGTRAVQTVDNAGNPVTRIVPDVPGSEFPDQPTSDQRNRDAALKKIDPILTSISDLSEKINTGKGLEAKARGEAEKLAAKANYNDDVAEYQAIISGFTPMVARAVGHTGVLTQQDVDSVRELFPKPGDSKTLRDRKIARVKSILAGEVSGAASGGGGKAPAGVDQDVWDVMTPEERKLWK